MEALPERVLLVDKPSGMSSFSLVREVKRRLGVKKAGHAGTLDPLASGLMIVGIDDGTKLLGGFVGLSKTYEATVCIGERADTGDRQGTVVEKQIIAHGATDEQNVVQALQAMTGALMLPVPLYSATKQGGEPLYKKMRAGKKVIQPMREMEVLETQLIKQSLTDGRLYVSVLWQVSSGTYIRSLAEELGRRLGYPATLEALRRTAIGHYKIEDAQTLDALGH